MWYEESVFYQIYPLGFTGAPKENDGLTVNRISEVISWIDHFKKLGINAIYFSPVFESDRHGYDTRDYGKIDCRLGTNEDFKEVCKSLHDANIRVVLDGVFNHVGRGFWAFQDVIQRRENSPYVNWFHISFDGNTEYNDGFWYEGWEGHNELVKLNLQNEEVIQHIFSAIDTWVKEFDIDGLRLDVAYCLNQDFLYRLHEHCKAISDEFFLLGELLHGDYNQFVSSDKLDSCTNYECYKGLYSSFNSNNFFEISYSLNRQFGKEQWCLYRDKHLLSFLDNHDVNRIASQNEKEENLPLLYSTLFAMPGIPCLYYGSEWGCKGTKENGSDDALRPHFNAPEWNELTSTIQTLIQIRKEHPALSYGDYTNILVQNKQMIFQRETESERILFAINIDDVPYHADFNANCGLAEDVLNGGTHDFGAGSDLEPHKSYIWICEK